MAVTQEQVIEALKECQDPEIPVNIVDLGLIYGIEVSPDDKVKITMTLTTPGCGMAYNIAMQAKLKVMQVPGVKEATVTIVWEPPWSPARMSDEAKKRLGYSNPS